MGLVEILARRSGAEVAAIASLGPWLAEYSLRMNEEDEFAEALMRRHGVSDETCMRCARSAPPSAGGARRRR
jgi:hypothetical protein